MHASLYVTIAPKDYDMYLTKTYHLNPPQI